MKIYVTQVWGGDLNGATRQYKKKGNAINWINKYLKHCYDEFGLSGGDCYAEIDEYEKTPSRFKHISHEEIG